MKIYKKRKHIQFMEAGIAAVITLSSCATPEGAGFGSEDNLGQVMGTLGGAAIGTAVGGRKRPLIGTAIGALVGYAAGYALDSYWVSQKKNAVEMNNEDKPDPGRQLLPKTVVPKYETRADPSGLVSRGSQLDIVSEIELAKGANSSNQKDRVGEELMISNASGKNTERIKKRAISEADAAGAYATRFTLKPTQEVCSGLICPDTLISGLFTYGGVYDDKAQDTQGI